MKKTWWLPLLVVCVLVSDSCQQPQRLWLLAQSQPAYASLYHLAQGSHEHATPALQQLTQQAIDQQQQHWLMLAAQLDSPQAAYALFQLTQEPSWLRQAASSGLSKAQYELALLSDNPHQKQQWLQQAAEAGLLRAQISLYQWHLLQKEPSKADNWLALAAQRDANSAFVWANRLWQRAEFAEAIANFQHAHQNGHAQAGEIAALTGRYMQAGQRWQQTFEPAPECQMRLRLMTDNLKGVLQAKAFVGEFAKDKRLQPLPLCIESIHWLEQGSLHCSPNWGKTNRISCDLHAIAEQFVSGNATHGIIFTQQGKANVHNGLMFLDWADSYSVFVHELAHFAGFIDEYPLSESLAERICNGRGQANIVIQTKVEPQQQRDLPTVEQLHLTRTCNNHTNQAYKRSEQLTFMEFYDQGVIPAAYLDIWQRQLHNRQQLVPAFVNFAQYYQQQGQSELADYWWQRYQVFLSYSLTAPGS